MSYWKVLKGVPTGCYKPMRSSGWVGWMMMIFGGRAGEGTTEHRAPPVEWIENQKHPPDA